MFTRPHGARMTTHVDITRLLEAHADGDRQALDELLPLVYGELQRIAHRRLGGERRGHTLNTTALVHEAYLKLVQLDRMNWQNRAHFFAIAAQVMRNVLVDYAVRQKAQKRGGGRERVSLDEIEIGTAPRIDELLALQQALERLGALDERQARVVECRVFGGMSIDETAHALGISAATVSRDWTVARAWLARELSTAQPASSARPQ